LIAEGAETDIIYPGDLDFSGCRGCEGCSKTSRCILADEMQSVYQKIEKADVL